jgi:hypothetical protein
MRRQKPGKHWLWNAQLYAMLKRLSAAHRGEGN